MKPKVVKYISNSLTCDQVKAEHQFSYGKVQSLQTQAGKWEDITMEFVMGLPRTSKGNNVIWAIVDRLTKSSLFLDIKESTPLKKLAKIYVDEVVRLHGPELVRLTNEKIEVIQANIKAAQDRKRSYASLKQKPYDIKEGELVMLKVSPWKGVMRFGKKGKLNPRYIGPFKMLKVVGTQAFKLEFPQELQGIHDTFHVSYLKKYFGKEELTIPLKYLRIDENKRLIEEPEAILEIKTKKIRNKEIDLVLVKWKHVLGSNITWETKEEMMRRYPTIVDCEAIPRTGSS
ncbi:uncharacterized protein LOC111907457 [Lactuca sativa]|uniref:uncharacterized protein LOC111907457 n=1 Tax=Lactuca sativa TaxID=4236 RepID=UPI000CD9D6DC|nr:uncharacterized protein LOC111907457 [Lactuca sativa]